MSRPVHIYKFSCKLAPKSVNPVVILDASTSKVFIICYKWSAVIFLSGFDTGVCQDGGHMIVVFGSLNHGFMDSEKT